RARGIAVKLHRRAFLDDDRQSRRKAALQQRANECPQIGLPADRPIEPDAARRPAQHVELGRALRNRITHALTLRERQRTTFVDQTSALRLSPALDVFPILHSRITSQRRELIEWT